MKKTIDDKVAVLFGITNNFLYIEYYSHTGCYMYKIKNEFTKFASDTLVLCPVVDGIEKAIDIAIRVISKRKKEYELESELLS